VELLGFFCYLFKMSLHSGFTYITQYFHNSW